MTSNTKIREGEKSDLLSLLDIQYITWLDTYPNKKYNITKKDIEKKFEDRLKKRKEWIKDKEKLFFSNPDKRHFWVAVNDNRIVGFCVAGKENSKHQIEAVYVLPQYQRQGIGKGFLKKALRWLGEDNDIYIQLIEYNTNTLNLYKESGFILTNLRGSYKIGNKKIPLIEVSKKAT